MRVDIAWWDLEGSAATIDSLGEQLGNGTVEAWADVPGLRLKLWMADRAGNRWGAVMLWDSDRPGDCLLPPNRAAEMIGRPADHRTQFDVEAAVEGMRPPGGLCGRGRASRQEDRA
jgi:trans-2,3-dihydro-3-hydroxyanthranilate isomerase